MTAFNKFIDIFSIEACPEYISPYVAIVLPSSDFIVIEGQASLRNPSGPCGGEFLISCSVDGVVLQHSPKRKYYDGWEHVGALMPSLASEVALIGAYGKRVVAIALTTSKMSEEEMQGYKKSLSKELNIPVFLPLEEGVLELAEILKKLRDDN